MERVKGIEPSSLKWFKVVESLNSRLESVAECGRSFRSLGRQFGHVQSCFPGIGGGERRTVGAEVKNLVRAGIVTRPCWQVWTVRVARLGEVCPIGVHHFGDLLVLRR